MKLSRLLAGAGLALPLAGVAIGAVTPEEAKQLGTTLTAVGAEQAGNADGTIPPVHGRPHDAAAGVPGRQRHPARPVRRRTASVLDRCDEPGPARSQADRRREGAAAQVPTLREPTESTFTRPTARRRFRSTSSTTRSRTQPGRRPHTRAARSRVRTPDSHFRSRRTATRRCGITCCASTASRTRHGSE